MEFVVLKCYIQVLMNSLPKLTRKFYSKGGDIAQINAKNRKLANTHLLQLKFGVKFIREDIHAFYSA